jgi:hypothetical protein
MSILRQPGARANINLDSNPQGRDRQDWEGDLSLIRNNKRTELNPTI